ncbi:MAG: hypothetical protein ACREQ7_05055 [Candidatus Binatia bacterium]
MVLDSARELKAMLVRRQLKPLMANRRIVSVLAPGARAVADVDAIRRTIALGVSRKGVNDFRLAVRVQNRSLEDGREVEKITQQAKGEVDIRYIGRLVKRSPAWHRSRQRPLLIGVSVGHFRITAGTLGCFVTRKEGAVRILSNNHVLADENKGKKGDAILQQGAIDGGKRGRDTIGALDRFVKLNRAGANLVDAALGRIRNNIEFDSETLRGVGKLRGVRNSILDIGDGVHKVGRTTGVTRGRVTAFELDNVVVAYDIGNLRFDDQIEIEGADAGPFSQGGDSGSLIVDDDRQAVALLFAGGDQGGANGKGFTYANPIAKVLEGLRVDLIA